MIEMERVIELLGGIAIIIAILLAITGLLMIFYNMVHSFIFDMKQRGVNFKRDRADEI